MSGADGILKAIEFLFSPDTLLWVKVVLLVGFVAAIIAWWTRPFWHDLHTPDSTVSARKARPPFK